MYWVFLSFLKSTLPCFISIGCFVVLKTVWSTHYLVLFPLSFWSQHYLVLKEWSIYCCTYYASCLEYLGNLKANLLVDIHLRDHVEIMYTQIRNQFIIQYTHPFVFVDLNMMANGFKTIVVGLQKELEALITYNQIKVKISSFLYFFV